MKTNKRPTQKSCSLAVLNMNNIITSYPVLGPVENLHTSEITSNSWILVWDEQTKSKCPTEEYIIQYALLNKDQCETYTDPDREPKETVQDTTVTISGLLPHSTYQVFVYPKNGLWYGVELPHEDVTKDAGIISYNIIFEYQICIINLFQLSLSESERDCSYRLAATLKITLKFNLQEARLSSPFRSIQNDVKP